MKVLLLLSQGTQACDSSSAFWSCMETRLFAHKFLSTRPFDHLSQVCITLSFKAFYDSSLACTFQSERAVFFLFISFHAFLYTESGAT